MEDDGATPRELLLEACRRNNTDLLVEIFTHFESPEKIAHFLNTATDGIGNFGLHIAVTYGSYDVLDTLLDQEGLEVDPVDRMEGDTPLHKAVRYVNSCSKDGWKKSAAFVELLIDAGADPRIRNKAKLKAMELVDPRNTELRLTLQRAEMAQMAGNDVVNGDDDDGPTGSASESD